MAWNDTPPTADELKRVPAPRWDDAPPTANELRIPDGDLPTVPRTSETLPPLEEEESRIAAKYGVDKDWLHDRQIGMGYYPEEEAERNIGAGENLKHLGTAASAAANSVLGEGVLGGLPEWVTKKLSSDNEEKAIDELRHAVDERKGGLDKFREAVLSATPGATASKAVGALGLGSKAKTAAQAGVALGDAARLGVQESDQGYEGRGAATGAALAAGTMGIIEGVPKVWNGVKWVGRQAKRLLPGTEGSVTNTITAKAASLMPYQSATADEIGELLAQPKLRREAARTDIPQEAMNLAPKLESAQKALDDAVSKRFREVEWNSLNPPEDPLPDLRATEEMAGALDAAQTHISAHKQLYGQRVQKLYDDILHIFSTGGPKEAGLATHGKPVNDLAPDLAAPAAKVRTLNARRHLDDFMRNKNWENLSQYEKEAVSRARDILDNHLKNLFSGAAQRAAADELYSGARQTADDFFKPITSRAPSGGRFVDPSKLKNFVKSGETRGELFDKRAGALQDFLQSREGEIGQLPEVSEAMSGVDRLREIGQMQRLKGNMERASGGPTSQAINFASQLGGAFVSGGASVPYQIAAYPVTNPAGWARFLDHMANISDSTAAKYGPVLRQAYESRGPAAAAAAHMLLMQRDPSYRKLFEEFDTAKHAKQALDRGLTKHVVEPLAQAGHPDLGAALATIPSTLVDATVPSSPMDLAPIPHGAAVMLGRLPFKEWLSKEEGQALRKEIPEIIENVGGNKHLFAEKHTGSAVDPEDWDYNIDEDTGDFVNARPPEAEPNDPRDTFYLRDRRDPNKIQGVVELNWAHGSPVTSYYQNYSQGRHPGAIRDFLDQLSQHTGGLTSSMEYKPTDGRFLGRELYEDRLPRVVAVPGGDKVGVTVPGEAAYRILSDEKYRAFLDANPDVEAQLLGILQKAE